MKWLQHKLTTHYFHKLFKHKINNIKGSKFIILIRIKKTDYKEIVFQFIIHKNTKCYTKLQYFYLKYILYQIYLNYPISLIDQYILVTIPLHYLIFKLMYHCKDNILLIISEEQIAYHLIFCMLSSYE